MRQPLRNSFLFALLFSIQGCPHRPPQIDPGSQIEDVQELLTAVKQQGERLKSMRATGSLVMRRGSKRLKAHIIVLVRRPANLRFETESFFDQPLSILVTDGMQFSLWDMDKGRFLVGKATPENISRVIPIPMDGPEVVGILAGDPPLIPYARATLQWQANTGRYVATLSNSRNQQKIFIHPHLLRPTLVTCHTAGKLFYRLEYEDFAKRADGAAAPRRILFEMPAKNIRLRVRIRDVEHNPDLTDDMFELLPPEEIAIERLD